MDATTAIEITDAVAHFKLNGRLLSYMPWGNGHMHETYCLFCEDFDHNKIRYILQRMNTDVFREPGKLMENIIGVTGHLRKKIIENGGDPERETINVIKTINDRNYYRNRLNHCFRVYSFIEGAKSYDQPSSSKDFYESGLAFGHFQSLLSDYNPKLLHETIKDFHNTKARFKHFLNVVAFDKLGRARECEKEIEFIKKRERLGSFLLEKLEKGEIPLRVTHNDTKLNTVMIDNRTRKGICIVDLDTTMPGLAITDFGDSIRFGASTAAEDETDLSKVSLSLELFEMYTKGFIEGCDGRLTKKEIELLPYGALLMTYECGMRFLTDYLSGDIYFRIHREHHNLERSRTQLKLLSDMEAKLPIMEKIVKKYMS